MCALSVADLEAVSTVHGSITFGLKGHLCLGTALRANDCIQLSGLTVAAKAPRITITFTRIAAITTARRFVLKTFFFVKLLFAGRENKLLLAILALKCFIDEWHLNRSLASAGPKQTSSNMPLPVQLTWSLPPHLPPPPHKAVVSRSYSKPYHAQQPYFLLPYVGRFAYGWPRLSTTDLNE
jgi:hypothetical protein